MVAAMVAAMDSCHGIAMVAAMNCCHGIAMVAAIVAAMDGACGPGTKVS